MNIDCLFSAVVVNSIQKLYKLLKIFVSVSGAVPTFFLIFLLLILQDFIFFAYKVSTLSGILPACITA